MPYSAGSPSPAVTVPNLFGQVVWPPGERHAPRFALRDQNGRLISLAGEQGRTVVLAFMDPRCGNSCLLEARGLADVTLASTAADRATLLIVSLNPLASEADGRSAGRELGLAGDWHWLLGTSSQLKAVWRAYGISLPARASVAHSTAVYVIDRSGFERAGVHAPFLPQFVADDLGALAE